MAHTSAPDEASHGGPILLNRRQMFLAYITGSFGFGFQALVAFIIPLRAHELGAPPEVIGLIIGAGGLLPIFLSIPAGELADRFGPRRVYVAGTVLSAAVTFCYALTTNYWVMLLLELAVGFPRTMPWIASQAYISHVGTQEQRPTIMGRFTFTTQFVQLIGPLIAGTVSQLVGYQSAFWVAFAAALGYTAMGLMLPEVRATGISKQPGSSGGSAAGGFGGALSLLGLRVIQVAMIMTFTRIWVLATWAAFYSLLLVSEGVEPFVVGTVLSISGVVATLMALTAGPLASRVGQVGGTCLALVSGCIGVMLSPWVAFFPLCYIPALFTGFANGITLPLLLAIVGEGAPPSVRGVAMGLRTSANRVAVTIAPIVMGGLVTAVGYTLAFSTGGIAGLLLTVAAVWRHRTGQQPALVPPDVTAAQK